MAEQLMQGLLSTLPTKFQFGQLMGKGKKNEYDNFRASNRILNELMEVALQRVEYINFPATLNIRLLERLLLTDGVATIHWDSKRLRWSVHKAILTAPNDEGEYVDWRAIGINGSDTWEVSRDGLNGEAGVLVWDNDLRTNTMFHLYDYAERIASIQRSFDVQADRLKNPIVIQVPKEQKQAAQTAWNKMKSNEPVILTIDEMTNIQSSELLTNVAYNGTVALQDRRLLTDECYRLLGIEEEDGSRENVATTFKTDQFVEKRRLNYLEPRRRAFADLAKFDNVFSVTDVVWKSDSYSRDVKASIDIEEQAKYGLIPNQVGTNNNAIEAEKEI